MTNVDSRSIRQEGPFLDALRSLDDAADLRRRLLDAGASPAIAAGLVTWLIAKAAGDPDLTNSVTRTRYRKILANLGEPTPPGPQRRRRRRPGAFSAEHAAEALPDEHPRRRRLPPELAREVLGLIDDEAGWAVKRQLLERIAAAPAGARLTGDDLAAQVGRHPGRVRTVLKELVRDHGAVVEPGGAWRGGGRAPRRRLNPDVLAWRGVPWTVDRATLVSVVADERGAASLGLVFAGAGAGGAALVAGSPAIALATLGALVITRIIGGSVPNRQDTWLVRVS